MASPVLAISPEGAHMTIPPDKWAEAEKIGFQRAMYATSPEGAKMVLPVAKWSEAQQSGFKPYSPVADLANQALASTPKSANLRVNSASNIPSKLPNQQGQDYFRQSPSPVQQEQETAVRQMGVFPHGKKMLHDYIEQQALSMDPEDTTTPKLAQFYKDAVAPVGMASANFVGSQVEPQNLATLGAFKYLPAVTPLLRTLKTAAGAYYGAQAAVGAGQEGKAAYDAYQNNDTPGVVEHLTNAGFQAGAAADTARGLYQDRAQIRQDVPAAAQQGGQMLARVTPDAIASRVYPQAIQTPTQLARGEVRQVVKQRDNLAAGLEMGGKPARGKMTAEDVAQPIVDEVRAEAARQGIQPSDLSGRGGYTKVKAVTEAVRQRYDDAYNHLLEPIRGEHAGQAAQQAATEVVNKMLSDSALMDEIKRGTPDGTNVQQLRNIADTIARARTVGELDAARIALNRLASRFEGKSEGQQYESPLVQEAMHEGANAIRNALYADMSQRYGGMTVNGESTGITEAEIRDIQRAHGAAIETDRMMADTARQLSSRASEEAAKPGLFTRLRGLGFRATLGNKEHAAAGLIEKLFPPSEVELFNKRMGRVIKGATPEDGRQFPEPPITPEYVDNPDVPDMRTSPVQPRLGPGPQEAQVVPSWLIRRPGLPPASRSQGAPEQATVDPTGYPPTNEPVSTPLGTTGNAGVLVRPKLLPGGTQPESRLPQLPWGPRPVAPRALPAIGEQGRQLPASSLPQEATPAYHATNAADVQGLLEGGYRPGSRLGFNPNELQGMMTGAKDSVVPRYGDVGLRVNPKPGARIMTREQFIDWINKRGGGMGTGAQDTAALRAEGWDAVDFGNGKQVWLNPEKATLVHEGAAPAEPRYAYRVRDVGEEGVPNNGSHSHATMSEQEARGYVESRGNLTGKPQEIVRIDLSKMSPDQYQVAQGPNGNDWVKFPQGVPEGGVERVSGLDATTPKAEAGSLPTSATAPVKVAPKQGTIEAVSPANGAEPWDKTGADIGNVYHGSTSKVGDVDVSKLGQRDAGFYGKGFYVTKAEHYAKNYGDVVNEKALTPDARVLDVGTIHPQFEQKVDPRLQQQIVAGERAYLENAKNTKGKPDKINSYLELIDPNRKDAFDLHSWIAAVNRYAEARGYDAIRFSDGEIVVKNPKAVSDSSTPPSTRGVSSSQSQVPAPTGQGPGPNSAEVPQSKPNVSLPPGIRTSARVAKTETKAPAEVRSVLESANRPFRIGGEWVTDRIDPIAEQVLPRWTPEHEAFLSKYAHGKPTYLGGGFYNVILDIGGGRVARMGTNSEPMTNIPEVLQPIARHESNGVRIDVMPKVDTTNITENDVREMRQKLASRGYDWTEAGTDNLGRTADGKLVVLDLGGIKKRPSQSQVPTSAGRDPEPTSPQVPASKPNGGGTSKGGAQKQPYEMTAREFGVPVEPKDTPVPKYTQTERIARENPEKLSPEAKALLADKKKAQNAHAKYIRDHKVYVEKSNEHFRAVKQAIEEGKIDSHPDYPSLGKSSDVSAQVSVPTKAAKVKVAPKAEKQAVAPQTAPPSELEGLKKQIELLERQRATTSSYSQAGQEISNQVAELKSKVYDIESAVRRSSVPRTEPPADAQLPDPKSNKWAYQREYFVKSLEPVKQAWIDRFSGEKGWTWDDMAKSSGTRKGVDFSEVKADSRPESFKDEFIHIEVPGDGKFLVKNNPVAIDKLLKSAPSAFAKPTQTGNGRRPVPRAKEYDHEAYIVSIEKEIAKLKDDIRREPAGTPSHEYAREELKAAQQNLIEAKASAGQGPESPQSEVPASKPKSATPAFLKRKGKKAQ